MFTLKNLGKGIAAHRGLDSVLHIGDVDLVARGFLAIQGNGEVGLPDDAKKAEILDSAHGAHDVHDLVALGFQGFQVIAEYFDREVKPYVADAWIDEEKTKVGYEIPLTRHFYKYTPPRPLEEIQTEIALLEKDILGMLREVVG